MTSYTFDAIDGYKRITTEEADALRERVGETGHPIATGYVQMPVVRGKVGGFLSFLLVQKIPEESGLPYSSLVWLMSRTLDGSEMFVTDELSLLELLARYAPFLTQPLNTDASCDAFERGRMHQRFQAERQRKAAERAGQRVTSERHL